MWRPWNLWSVWSTNLRCVGLCSSRAITSPSSESDRLSNQQILDCTYSFLLKIFEVTDRPVPPSQGADVNVSQPSDGTTALIVAAAFGHLRVVETLLSAKADPNKPNAQGRVPLGAAAEGGHNHIVQLLVCLLRPPLPVRQWCSIFFLLAGSCFGLGLNLI